jgi:hypothetical protein
MTLNKEILSLGFEKIGTILTDKNGFLKFDLLNTCSHEENVYL